MIRRLAICLAIALLATAAPAGASGLPPNNAQRSAAAVRAEQVRAAFIFNFVQFIEWPADTFTADDSPYLVGVLADDNMYEALRQALAGKSIQGRPLRAVRFESVSAVNFTHVLYVPEHESARLPDILRSGRRGTLTVGETERFMADGGIIRFVPEDGRLRFQVNPDAAAAQALKVSSKLLQLARIYRK